MKKLQLISVIFILTIIGAIFVGCSSDDDNYNSSSNENLVGFWVRYENNDQYMEEIGFFADGTCSYTEAFEPDDDNDEKPFMNSLQGTYNVKGNKLIVYLNFDGETEIQTYTIKFIKSKDVLVLIDEEGDTYKFVYWITNEDDNDTGDDDNTSKDNNDNEDNKIKVDYKNLTYKIDGKTYRFILVDGGYLKPFYMMQTELPPEAYFQIGDFYAGALNDNMDRGVIKTEIRTFIDKLREATGLGIRLPTTAEWQFAASGGSKSKNYTYSGSNDIDDVCWYKGNSGNTVHGVAEKKPNELGLYDMTGNYQEVCNDTEDYAHLDGHICGGNWFLSASECKAVSVKNSPISGKVPGSRLKEKNAFDAKYITVRLVYSAPSE